MNNVFENPLPIVFVGVLVFAVLLAVWTQQRKRKWVVAMICTVAVVICGIILEIVVVTDGEEVAATIHQIANDMESNNVPAVLGHISTSAGTLQANAEAILKKVKVDKVSVKRNLTVTVSDSATRKSAIAKFNAVARVDDKSATFGNQTVPRLMILNLVKEGDRWRVVQYEARLPHASMGD